MALAHRYLLTLLLIAATACEDDQRSVEHPTKRESEDPVSDCSKSYPRTGTEPSAPEPIHACEEDSGECTASIPCTGELEDRICDAARLITREAAICIADANGLDHGLNGLHAQLVYNSQHRRIVWAVMNTRCSDQTATQCESGDSSGEILHVDAVSGEVIASLGWLSIS